MKKIFLLLIVMLPMCVSAANNVTAVVTNPAALPCQYETVEVPWSTLSDLLLGISPENVVVTNSAGEQIPSQAVYAGRRNPQLLVFQVSLQGNATAEYTISAGKRNAYPRQTYGRQVPERKEDYTWENNVAAFRVYGAALEYETIASGIDFWGKTTDRLVINEWYERDLAGKGSYHTDLGEGNDAYKVGSRSFGVGASIPVSNGKLMFANHNYSSYRILDSGAVRTSVELTYPKFAVGEDSVSFTKTITLDANSNFNRVTDIYKGDVKQLDIALGMLIHKDAEVQDGSGFCALYENDDDKKDGKVGIAVVANVQGSVSITAGNALVRLLKINTGMPLTYYAGAATSKRGISQEQWFEMVSNKADMVKNPLKVRLK